MKIHTTVLLLFLSFRLLANPEFTAKISGYVIDSVTGEELENVNVYISNTTLGAATDRDGFYIIEKVPEGTHELIVSIVGYDYLSELILIKENDELLRNFKLNPRIYETSSTEVLAEIPYDWLNNLEIFNNYFIGQTAFAEECLIENEEVLDFSWESGGILKASATAPLLIRNSALGYDIRCILSGFRLNHINEKWSWSVKPVFTQLESDDPEQNENWAENRRDAYAGSPNHFFISLIRHRLSSQSYSAYFVSHPGQRFSRRETVHYIEPYEELFAYGDNDNTYILHFKECLCVVHDITHVSWIELNLDEVIIDKYGYPQTPSSYRVYGYWASRGIADSLPFYFQPD